MSDFVNAIEYCILREGGGYTNYAADYGGPTKWGVTADRLREYQNLTGRLRGLHVSKLKKGDAIAIYYKLYWHHLMTNIESPELTAKLLDFRIMRGWQNGTKTAQLAINAQHIYADFFCNHDCSPSNFPKVDVDGYFGPQTLIAINESCPTALMVAMMMEISTHHARFTRDAQRDQRVHIAGWINRAFMYPGVPEEEIQR